MSWFYRLLLRLYPAGYRAEYGDQLCEVFGERMREHTGPLAPLTLAAAALADVIPNALSVHFDILRQDVRYTVRALRRTPGFALAAILVVALGVGANTAAFSLADFVLFRPLPFPEPHRLVRLWQSTPGYGQMELSAANYRDWKVMSTAFAGMAAYMGNEMNLVGEGEPRRLAVANVTPDLLPLLGVPAAHGRLITRADSVQGSVAIISHALWQSHFGGNPSIIGRTVRLDGEPNTIIGVMPPTFHFPNREVDVWLPLLLAGDDFTDRNDNSFDAIGRLAPGVTLEAANADLSRVAALLQEEYPKELKDVGAAAYGLQDQLSERTRLLVLALGGASLCILLLACANLASLLLARGLNRTREVAVRSALGAGRERLVRQLITESVGLALIGGVIGVWVASAGLPLLAQLVPSTLPIAGYPSVDLRVLGFAAALIASTGLAFGVVPALRVGKRGALEALREGTRTAGGRRQHVRGALVVLELTGSIVLLISSGLLVQAIWRIQAVQPGFRTEGMMTLRTALSDPKYQTTASRNAFYTQVLEQVNAIPGVENAAYITGLPMVMRGGVWPVEIDGSEVIRDGMNTASLRFVTAALFSTLGIPVRRGRDIDERDTSDGLYVAVVSESFAQRHWPGRDPIGRQFGFAFSKRTVVGVVADVRVRGLERTSEPQVYVPSTQVADGWLRGYTPKELVVRSTLPAEQLVPALRRIITAVDPEQPISRTQPLAEIVGQETAPRLVQLRLLIILSGLALLIAGVGIHGLLSFTVSQRGQELAIRRALGAQVSGIVGMVLGEGLRLAAAGTVAGVVVALLVGRSMSALLFGVQPYDPQTIFAAVGLCLITVIIGCLRPALRAGRVDAMSTLRGG